MGGLLWILLPFPNKKQRLKLLKHAPQFGTVHGGINLSSPGEEFY